MSSDLSTDDQKMTAHQAKLLDAFLVENPELEQLSAKLSEFNLFKVLKIERAEIRHSNILAWLLSPDEGHGLDTYFLRRFLSRLLMENEDVKTQLTPAKIELMRLSDVDVYREWQGIDIFVHSRKEGWALIIENKIGSKESPGQLLRYVNSVRQIKEIKEIIPVLLTLEGDEPSEEATEQGFVSLDHSIVLDVCDSVVSQHRSRIPDDARLIINHYLSTLRRLTMRDEELANLCKQIYRKHREAIDLIVEYGASSQVIETCLEELPKMIICEFIERRGNRVWFLPSEIGDRLPDMNLKGWPWLKRPVPIICWFAYIKRSGKLQCAMEVGPIDDPKLRIKFMKILKKEGFSFYEKGAFSEDAKYTRIVSVIKKLRSDEEGEPDDSPEYISDLAQSLWKNVWDKGNKITSILDSFSWK